MKKGVVITPEDLNGFDWLEEAAALGFDTVAIHNGGSSEQNKLSVEERLGFTISDEFRQRASSAKVAVEYELHAGSKLLPRALFGAHPEYFPVNGWDRRVRDYNCCPSSAAPGIMAENAAALAGRLRPDTSRYFFWGDDCAEYCHCDKCAHYNWADQELLISNTIGARLREVDKDAKIAFLAYLVTMQKPLNVRPADNVFLEFAPVRRCYRHSIDNPRCSTNQFYHKTLLELLEVFPAETAHVLEYYLDSSLFSNYKKPAARPIAGPEVVAADLKAYHGLGIRSLSTFAVMMDGEYFSNNGRKELDVYAGIMGKFA